MTLSLSPAFRHQRAATHLHLSPSYAFWEALLCILLSTHPHPPILQQQHGWHSNCTRQLDLFMNVLTEKLKGFWSAQKKNHFLACVPKGNKNTGAGFYVGPPHRRVQSH